MFTMTSANVVIYVIRKDGAVVGEHRVNILCKPNWAALGQYAIATHTIQPTGFDEDEAPWEGDEEPLEVFLLRIRQKCRHDWDWKWDKNGDRFARCKKCGALNEDHRPEEKHP